MLWSQGGHRFKRMVQALKVNIWFSGARHSSPHAVIYSPSCSSILSFQSHLSAALLSTADSFLCPQTMAFTDVRESRAPASMPCHVSRTMDDWAKAWHFSPHTRKYKLAFTKNFANNFGVFTENVIPTSSLQDHNHHGYNLCLPKPNAAKVHSYATSIKTLSSHHYGECFSVVNILGHCEYIIYVIL